MCFAVLTRISSEYFELLLGMSFSSCFYPYGITESTGHFFTALQLAIYGKNPVLGAAVLILGIGHIGIHWMHKKEI